MVQVSSLTFEPGSPQRSAGTRWSRSRGSTRSSQRSRDVTREGSRDRSPTRESSPTQRRLRRKAKKEKSQHHVRKHHRKKRKTRVSPSDEDDHRVRRDRYCLNRTSSESGLLSILQPDGNSDKSPAKSPYFQVRQQSIRRYISEPAKSTTPVVTSRPPEVSAYVQPRQYVLPVYHAQTRRAVYGGVKPMAPSRTALDGGHFSTNVQHKVTQTMAAPDVSVAVDDEETFEKHCRSFVQATTIPGIRVFARKWTGCRR